MKTSERAGTRAMHREPKVPVTISLFWNPGAFLSLGCTRVVQCIAPTSGEAVLTRLDLALTRGAAQQLQKIVSSF